MCVPPASGAEVLITIRCWIVPVVDLVGALVVGVAKISVLPVIAVGFSIVEEACGLVRERCDDKDVLLTQPLIFDINKLFRHCWFILCAEVGFGLLCDEGIWTFELLDKMFDIPWFFFAFAAEKELGLGHVVVKDPG